MAIKVPGRNGGTIYRAEVGDPSPNPYGRPKKYLTQLKGYGYQLFEINDTLQTILALTKHDLEKIVKKEDSTILEKIVAKALLVAAKKGNLGAIETLLTRIYGAPAYAKPPETKDDDYSKLTPAQLAARLVSTFNRSQNDRADESRIPAGDDQSTSDTGNPEPTT